MHVGPVPGDASPASAGGNLRPAAYPKVIRRVVQSIAQVRGIVPQYADAQAHPWRNEVPQIPLVMTLAVIIGASLGALVGEKCHSKVSPQFLRRAYSLVVAIVALRVWITLLGF